MEDDLPLLTLDQFIRAMAILPEADDEVLSAATLRMSLRDIRDHARRFLADGALSV